MKYRAIWLLLPLMLGLPSLAAEGPSPEPVVLVEWGSEESVERLARSSYKTDFFPLSNHFESQDNLLFCGLASSVMVLNALRMGKREGLPQDEQSIPKQERVWLPEGFNPFFGKYTQNNVLSDRAKHRVEVLGKPIPIGGHISPLGAYDEMSDSFLIMDVDPNIAPWVWVESDDLIGAMRTFDTVENRGYVLVAQAQ